MKTIYKLLLVLLAILAAYKMFAGGGVSKQAGNRSKKNGLNTVFFHKLAAETQGDLEEAIYTENLEKFQEALAVVEKYQLQDSTELKFGHLLNLIVSSNSDDRTASYIPYLAPYLKTEDIELGLAIALAAELSECIEALIKLLEPKRNQIAVQINAAAPQLPPALGKLIADYAL